MSPDSPLRRLRRPGLGRNTLVSSAGLGVRWLAQALSFFLVARFLGPSEYGMFVAVAAAASILAPFASWGMGDRIVRAVAKNPEYLSTAWATGLFTIVTLGSLLSWALVWTGTQFFPETVDVAVLLPIALAELLAAPAVAVAASAFQATEQMGRHAGLWLGLVVARGAAAIAFVSLGSASAAVWAHWYLAASLAAAAWAIVRVTALLGRPRLSLKWDTKEAKDGFVFAVGLSSLAIANDVDKTMLARISNLAEVGIYGVGYKAAQVAFTPIVGLLDSTYARFFKAGDAGPDALRGLLKKVLPPALAYSTAASVALWMLAPTLAWVLGPEYGESPSVIRWLAVVPLLKTAQLFAANALTGSGLHGFRTTSQITMALMNVGLNMAWIPSQGWLGAVKATLIYELLLTLLLWGRASQLLSRGVESGPPPT